MDDSGVYDDPGTGAEQPNTEQSRPEGGGVGSGSSEGANKLDPVSAGPNLGSTIAGRRLTGRQKNDLEGEGSGLADSATPSGSDQAGSEKSGGKGVTGQTGREMGEGTGTTKGSAAESVNPGNSTSNPPPSD